MATQPGIFKIVHSFPASADLSDYQFYFVELDGSYELQVCNGAGDFAHGVLQNKPDEQGKNGEIVILGPTKLVAGGAIVQGALITTTAAGKALTIDPVGGAGQVADAVLGRAMEAAAADTNIFGAWVNCITPYGAQ